MFGRPTVRFAGIAAVVAAGLYAQPGISTVRPSPLWEALVLEADFVGIVECTTAGVIVANYKVIETWKGDVPTGAQVSIRAAEGCLRNEHPVTLCSERFLVALSKSEPRGEQIDVWDENLFPLCWRDIPTDYRILQSRVELPLGDRERPLGRIGSSHPDLKSFRAAHDALLAMSSEQQEILLLKKCAEISLATNEACERPQDVEAWKEKTRTAVAAGSSARDIVRSLVRAAKDCPKYCCRTIRSVLGAGGGAVALGILEESDDALPFDGRARASMCRRIRRRLRLPIDPTEPPAADHTHLLDTSAELQAYRDTFEMGPKHWSFFEAFVVLTEHAPETVTEFLIGPMPPSPFEDYLHGYIVGSYFGWRCRANRETHLSRLLDARVPYIRVAGAVYLCLENEADGVDFLADLAELDGDPGVWAALNLVRRGEKAYVPRVLEVFKYPTSPADADLGLHVHLEKRVVVLLSNTAKANGLPQPKPPERPWGATDVDDRKIIYHYYKHWWEQNGTQATIHDPWFDVLKKQKID